MPIGFINYNYYFSEWQLILSKSLSFSVGLPSISVKNGNDGKKCENSRLDPVSLVIDDINKFPTSTGMSFYSKIPIF